MVALMASAPELADEGEVAKAGLSSPAADAADTLKNVLNNTASATKQNVA
jgi:hypothetical protein